MDMLYLHILLISYATRQHALIFPTGVELADDTTCAPEDRSRKMPPFVVFLSPLTFTFDI